MRQNTQFQTAETSTGNNFTITFIDIKNVKEAVEIHDPRPEGTGHFKIPLG